MKMKNCGGRKEIPVSTDLDLSNDTTYYFSLK
jgi:hypothetical protein